MKITLYMAISADGFVAEEDGGVRFLDKYTHVEAEGYVDYHPFLASIDAIAIFPFL